MVVMGAEDHARGGRMPRYSTRRDEYYRGIFTVLVVADRNSSTSMRPASWEAILRYLYIVATLLTS